MSVQRNLGLRFASSGLVLSLVSSSDPADYGEDMERTLLPGPRRHPFRVLNAHLGYVDHAFADSADLDST